MSWAKYSLLRLRRENERKMKLVLVQPPIQDFYQTSIRLQPIGLAYLKGAVQKFLPEVKVKILDFHHGFGRKTIPIPRELSYLKDFYPCPDTSPFCTFYHYYHFGADFIQAAQIVAEEQPDLVGISILFSPYFREALRLAQEIKKRIPVPVIAGGSHVSAEPYSILKKECIDFIIQGEGEKPLVEFLKEFTGDKNYARVPGLGFKENGQVHLNPVGSNYDLDKLPLPDLSDFPLTRYRMGKDPIYFITTSRGCPHKCSFCSVGATFGTGYRKRTVDSILEEMKIRYEQGYRVFDFEDDNLTFFQDEMKNLCLAIQKTFPPGQIRLVAMNGLSYLHLDDELLTLMRQAGFTDLNLALVSSDQSVLKSCHRPHTVEKFTQVVNKGFELGFHMVAYQILGLPQESLASMIKTLAFLTSQPVLIGPSLFYLAPGSKIAQKFAPLAEKDFFLARSTAMAIETQNFSREDLYSLFICTRIINFLKSISGKENIKLSQVLCMKQASNKRFDLGLTILNRLILEKALYAYNGQSFHRLPKFKWEIFKRVFSNLKFITCKDKTRIEIDVDF